MPRRVPWLAALTLLLTGALPAQPACGTRCGSDRWPVKTLSDADRGRVNLTPRNATVGRLSNFTAPRRRPPNGRVPPVELQVYRVHARLVGWKRESNDHDFHLVIADPANPLEHMVAEVPDVACAGVCASRHVTEIRTARRTLVAQLGAPPARIVCFAQPPLVEITGVGFFDKSHGQTGPAPNFVELHPVLSVRFDDPGARPTPARGCAGLITAPNVRRRP